MARNRKRKKNTRGLGPKAAVKKLSEDGKLGKRDLNFLAKTYPDLKASTIRNITKKNDTKTSGNIKNQLRTARGQTTGGGNNTGNNGGRGNNGGGNNGGRGNNGGGGNNVGGNNGGGGNLTADEIASAVANALGRKDESDNTATMGEYQNIDDGQTLGLKPGEQIKNVLSGLTIDKNIYKKAFYKKKGELGPLTKKLNQYKDFYDKNSKNTIKVDGKKKNYLQLLKDKATQRMKIDPSKYGRRDKAEYESIKDKLDKGKGMQMFNDLSLAEKYDVSKKTLFKQLQKPLNKVITEKLDDRLSNFKIGKKGEVKGIKFNQQKFDEYSKAGPGISDRVVDAAKALGVRDIAGVSGSSGRMKRIKNISDRVKSKAQTKRSTSSDYKKQFGQELQYQPLEYI